MITDTSPVTPPRPQQGPPAPARQGAAKPVPGDPAVPTEILALAKEPLFSARYRGTERSQWRDGLPLLGRKVTSTRDVAFSNEFNILRSGTSPFVSYAASSLDDAVRAARDLAFRWSDPSIGGAIYSSVGVAVLQASDGAFFSALVGSGNPRTSSSALSYRSDRYDNNIRGSIKRSSDARAVSKWTAPVDRDGKPVDLPPPADDRRISNRKVRDIKLEQVVPATPMLKAIVDINDLHEVN